MVCLFYRHSVGLTLYGVITSDVEALIVGVAYLDDVSANQSMSEVKGLEELAVIKFEANWRLVVHEH